MNILSFKMINFLTVMTLVVIICLNIYTNNDVSLDILPITVPGMPEEFAILTPGCKISKLDPFHSSLRPYIKNYSGQNLECTNNAMVFAINHTLMVNKKHKEYGTKTKCYYKVINRLQEDLISYGKVNLINKHKGTIVTSEFVMVECFNGKPEMRVYQDFFAFIIRKAEVEDRYAKVLGEIDKKQQLSVFLFGLDSVSKNSYIRHLHLVDTYIREKLTFVELHGYNKLGVTTFSNMIPFQTGRAMQDFGLNYKYADLNELPMIWKDFAQRGYRTLFAEDCHNIATFNHEKRGFDKQPTDYYMRPFSIAFDISMSSTNLTEGCYHYRTEASVIYNWTLDFFNEFPNDPLFAYTFLTRLSHDDYNTVAYYDQPIFDLLKAMDEAGHLNKTIVFFFSDHGYRFGGIRTTYVGHLEEKSPFSFILLPNWFPEVYPGYYNNLKLNERRLTTHFDMHATLLDILSDFQQVNEDVDPHGRSISLFTPISKNRTCDIADIDYQFCVCFERENISIADERAQEGAKLLLDYVNEMLVTVKSMCVSLELKKILGVLAHDVNIDKNVNEIYTNYLITFEVNPSKAILQGIVLYYYMNSTYIVETNVDRLNTYGNQSDCITDPYLRQFCYCKSNLE